MTTDGTVSAMACEHRLHSAVLAADHLRAAGALGSWQLGSLILGRCPAWERTRGPAA